MHPTSAKLAEDEITAYTFSNLRQGNLPFSVTFTVFLLLFTFTFNPFDSNAPFHASSLPFRLSLVSLISSHQHTAVILDILISLDSASSTIINNKGLTTGP